MAKKQPGQPAPPKVSQLPLPISDSPLVIDLPDGQKLVIGKMAEGSVIEVATWRGTGRPDSRTSRLMLGMSSGELEKDASETTGTAQSELEGFAKYLEIVRSFLKGALSLISKIPFGKLKKIKLPKIKPGSPKSMENKVESQGEVDDWLAAIIKKVESNNQTDPRVSNSNKSKQKASPIKKKAASTPRKTVKGKK